MRSMSLDAWIDRYEPVYDQHDCLLEIPKDAYLLVQTLIEARLLWTERSDGHIEPGYRRVNFLRLLVTNKPWRSKNWIVQSSL